MEVNARVHFYNTTALCTQRGISKPNEAAVGSGRL